MDNIKLNNSKNVFPFNLAVGGKSGERNLFINPASSGMHSLVFEGGSGKEISVDCISLEEIFRNNKIGKCDFLKIDCEGAEYEILYETPINILKRVDKIALEFDNIDKEKKNCFALKEFLEKNNFEVKINGSENHQGILYAHKK